jgi:hypothetical protein
MQKTEILPEEELKQKGGRECDSSGKDPTYQAWGPEFKLQYRQKKKERKEKEITHMINKVAITEFRWNSKLKHNSIS